MEPNAIWFIILLLVAAVFLAAELVIPSHGLLTVMAGAALLCMVAVAFSIGRWFGFGAVVALTILGPVCGSMMVRAWQRSPIGRRIVLHSIVENPPRPIVLVGAVGTTMGELRPMGECEFGDIRLRARSEMGDVIPAGRTVTVIAIANSVVTVRPVTESTL